MQMKESTDDDRLDEDLVLEVDNNEEELEEPEEEETK